MPRIFSLTALKSLFCSVHQEPSPQESPEGTICIVTLPTIWIENWEVIHLRLPSFFTLYCFPERCHLCFGIWTFSTNDFQCKSSDKSSPLSYRPVHSRSRIIYTSYYIHNSFHQSFINCFLKQLSTKSLRKTSQKYFSSLPLGKKNRPHSVSSN